MTPRELVEWIDGFRWRHRQQQELVLNAALLIVSAWVENPPTLDDLLPEHPADGERLLSGRFMSEDQLDALYAKQAKRNAP